MIWILGLALALVVSVYLVAPFLARDVTVKPSDEITAYREELRALEQNEHPAKAEIARLQTRLLKAAKSEAPQSGTRSTALPVLISLAVVGCSLGLYAKLGSPNFQPQTTQRPPQQQAGSDAVDFNALLPRFEAQLAETPDDAKGWYLYGRTLMLAGQPTAGLRAYSRAMELSDDPDIRKEYEAAKTFATQAQRGPSAEDIAAMQNLSETDRNAAIKNMVETLRARLEETPNNPEGWERLLRSRKVLGQTELAREDIAALRRALPEQADSIISNAGWAE